jgi:hypothetical protein
VYRTVAEMGIGRAENWRIRIEVINNASSLLFKAGVRSFASLILCLLLPCLTCLINREKQRNPMGFLEMDCIVS